MTQALELRYEDSPRYATAAIAGFIVFLVVVDLLLGIFIPEAFWIMVAGAAVELGLIYFIIPRKYQIFSDRTRIVLGGPFKMDLMLSTIKEARSGRGADAFVYWGLRMATSGNGVIEIVRRGGLDVVISPRDPETFLEQIRLALASADRNLSPRRIRLV